MRLAYFDIHWYYSAFAGFLTWLLLAGYLISPSTYASIENTGGLGKSLMNEVLNIPLIGVASGFCALSLIGLVTLWSILQHNYIWVQRHIVL
jgi:hypothetical protein